MFINVLLTSVAAVWLLVHQIVKRRFRDLGIQLPTTYQSAIAVPPEEGELPQLIALSIDLSRKQHCAVPFDTLNAAEKRLALHAFAVEKLPGWMSQYASLRLRPAERAVIRQLRQVKTSRPVKKQVHFGAVQRIQQLRSRPEI